MTKQSHRGIEALAALMLTVLSGCASTSPSPQYLDPRTGATITTAAAPMVFARTDSRYSRSGRDYVYLGPVSLNRQGVREHFLWVGLASTIDRGYLAPARGAPSKLLVIVDGELMEFALSPWAELAGPSAEPSYATRVAVRVPFAARATVDQLDRLSAHPIQSIYLADADGQQTFSFWERGEWSDFLRGEDNASIAREAGLE